VDKRRKAVGSSWSHVDLLGIIPRTDEERRVGSSPAATRETSTQDRLEESSPGHGMSRCIEHAGKSSRAPLLFVLSQKSFLNHVRLMKALLESRLEGD
jgi:hypothetical protein